MRKESTVIPFERVRAGTEYTLSELPDGINFLTAKGMYRTVTYPRYVLAKMNTHYRTCLNLVTLKLEEVSYSEKVTTVQSKKN
jgi:hypothetical protein